MKVAIIQNHFIHGGRLRLLSSLISYLNSQGIIPDIISYKMEFDEKDISEFFGIDTSFNVITLVQPRILLSQEMQIIIFNLQVKSLLKNYHCVINSSNSWIGISKFSNVLHYIHFPRKYRLRKDIHSSELNIQKTRWYMHFHNLVMRLTYSLFDREAPLNIIANSEFTASAIQEIWENSHCHIIHPPISEDISITHHDDWQKRTLDYVLLGRFSSDKGQLQFMDQVKGIRGIFHIIGFADTDSKYFNMCMKKAKSLDNIILHPNLSNAKRNEILRSARYYIHTMVNEPFGLSITESLSHGLLPVIHSSGGAKEIVPYPELQYNNPEKLKDALNSLQKISDFDQHEMLTKLQKKANTLFGMNTFNDKWQKQLKQFINV